MTDREAAYSNPSTESCHSNSNICAAVLSRLLLPFSALYDGVLGGKTGVLGRDCRMLGYSLGFVVALLSRVPFSCSWPMLAQSV